MTVDQLLDLPQETIEVWTHAHNVEREVEEIAYRRQQQGH